MHKIWKRLYAWLQLPAGMDCDPLERMSLRDLADLPTRRVMDAPPCGCRAAERTPAGLCRQG